MTCKCGSERIANVYAKCSDSCAMEFPNRPEYDGYVPLGVGIGGGDSVEFDYCLDCGQIQGDSFPITQEAIDQNFNKSFDDAETS